MCAALHQSIVQWGDAMLSAHARTMAALIGQLLFVT